MPQHNPNSFDAIMARLELQDEYAAEKHTQILKRLDDGAQKFETHERRIATLENWKWYATGAVLASGALADILIRIFSH